VVPELVRYIGRAVYHPDSGWWAVVDTRTTSEEWHRSRMTRLGALWAAHRQARKLNRMARHGLLDG
jgi:hypothetical protein